MNIADEFINQSRRFLAEEYPTKIERCLDVLPAEALWRRPNDSSNSIGNLLLHLTGNVRQWIVSGVGGTPDTRRRGEEFAATEGADAASLMAALRATIGAADSVLASLDASSLAETRAIQGRSMTVFDTIYHVVEHFSMHTGQIILLTKTAAEGRVQFYAEDAAGTAMPIWMKPSAKSRV
jgi:uncharacterized damage-inducible protein DinB